MKNSMKRIVRPVLATTVCALAVGCETPPDPGMPSAEQVGAGQIWFPRVSLAATMTKS